MNTGTIMNVQDVSVSLHAMTGIARILDKVDIELARGEILGVVGESGCGKSILVKTLLGILPDNAQIGGHVEFCGFDLATLSESEFNRQVRGKRIGFIPQDPFLAFNPTFKVGSQILEIMRWHASGPRRRHREKLVELLRLVRLPDPELALERYPFQFSGGQRQRLLIAAAMSCEPDLIIADEPTTALDVTTQSEILELLKDVVARRGLSMIFVTHDLGVVAQLCDRICIMYAGQTVEIGETAQTLRDPLHPYTRALLDCHPERTERFEGIPGVVPAPTEAPEGCRFEPRCSVSRHGCTSRASRLLAAGEDRRVNCIHFEDPAI
jgi:peptide/nickel transport system ATP-binding protein